MISPPRKRISLSGELGLVIDALRALVAVRESRHVRASVALIVERLRLLERATRSQVDPALLHCPENRAFETLERSDDVEQFDAKGEGDVILSAWTNKQLAVRAREELHRVRRARKWEKSRRKAGHKTNANRDKTSKVPGP